MHYHTENDEVLSWYASFHRAPTWRLDRQKGISRVEVQELLDCA
jgi:hypothetical protein